MGECILKMEHITQQFPGVLALDNVDFELKKGEIHALVGENGAGKSTLMKILTGVNKPNSGKITMNGIAYGQLDIEKSKKLGINMIYQELNLIPQLKIYENIFLGKEPVKNGRINKKEMRIRAGEIIESLGIQMNVEDKITDLTMAYKQMVEIARALLDDPKILIMDEPTGPLTSEEVSVLFRAMRVLKKRGVSIIYISHRLEEIFEVCDICTVFRDGKHIKTVAVDQTDTDELIRLMVGRSLENQYPPRLRSPENAKNIFEVKHLTNHKIRDISFVLKEGEILGIGGLVGAGRTETLRAIFGCDPCQGTFCKYGREIRIHSPEDAIKEGIVLATEDRKGQGLLLNLSVSDNIVLPVIKKLKKRLFIDRSSIAKQVQSYIEKLNIKTPSQKQTVSLLSGGNQQKVIVSRWLLAKASIILFDEPTRGIDVGAKFEIYTLMNELKDSGKSIIMVSSDMPELMGMSDRIIVMSEGRITGELTCPEEFSQEDILKKASVS